ncbi:MAG: DUF61 family protein [Candidatus Caldarchaeum sp.]
MLERIDSFLSNILKTVNESVPRRVIRYREIVSSGVYSVETVGGGLHHFDPQEVKKIGEELPSEILDQLHLPFIFVKNTELEESVYLIRVYGSEVEAFQKLMNVKTLPRSSRGPYTYKPLVAEFINRYPSLAVMGCL